MNIALIINGLFTAIYWLVFARIILSFLVMFIHIDPYNPIIKFIYEITEPIMAPFRKLIPPIGGMDLSPIVLFLVIQLLEKWVLQLFG